MRKSEDTTNRPGGGALGEFRVARIGLGAMHLAGAHSKIDPATGARVLRTAVELGVNHFDTAQFYGSGAVNRLLGATLAADDVVLATKVGAEHDPDRGLVPAQRPEQLRASVEENLTTLGVERVAVVNLRRLDHRPGILAEGDQVVDMDSQLAELIALREAGKIGAIGLSNVDAEQLRAALPADIVCVQNMHNLLDRSTEPVLRVCREHDIAWVPYFPLGSGIPDRPKVTDHPVVVSVATALGVAPALVGLAWELAHYHNTLLIPGTTNPDHLRDNIAAGDLALDPAARAALDAISPA